MRVSGRTAIVTGGASGLGCATARALTARGAKVAMLDLKEAALARMVEELGGMGLVCDVSSDKSVADALDRITATLGTPSICVNCAGIAPAKRMIGRQGAMPLDDFIGAITVNLVGTFNVMRLVAQAMSLNEPSTSGERGVIVNTTSIAAFEGQIGQCAYAASKGGVAALTLPAARELAQFGIRVLGIAPGIFLTPMLEALPPEAQRSLGAAVPFPQRLGRPEEFASLVVHMIENEMLNGENVRLDGAVRLQPK